MALVANITPITFLGDTITRLRVWTNRYTLGEDYATFHWELNDANGANVKDGDVVLSGDVITNWGTDDTPIIHAVAAEIGVTVDTVEDYDPSNTL